MQPTGLRAVVPLLLAIALPFGGCEPLSGNVPQGNGSTSYATDSERTGTPSASVEDSDASGRQVISFKCDWNHTVAVDQDTYSTYTRTWFADVEVPGLEPAMGPNVQAYSCDKEVYTQAIEPCDYAGAEENCLEIGIPMPSLGCEPLTLTFDVGRVVVLCGQTQEANYVDPELEDILNGWRAKTGYVVLMGAE